MGSAKPGGMLRFERFYQAIGDGEPVGEALRVWFDSLAPYTMGHVYWHFGMALLGDPLVAPLGSRPPPPPSAFAHAENSVESIPWTWVAPPGDVNASGRVTALDCAHVAAAARRGGEPGTDWP